MVIMMMNTKAVLVLVACVASTVGGVRVCEYLASDVCDAQVASQFCYTSSSGSCLGIDSSNSVKLTCEDDKVNFQRWATSDCSGEAASVVIGAAENACFQSTATNNSYEWSDCPNPCFPADSTVELRGGLFKRMDEIAIGDQVRVSPVEFSPVYFWGHKDAAITTTNYIELVLESGRSLTLSSDHMVYANAKLVPAVDVRVGDFLIDAHDGSRAVLAIRIGVPKRGLYNPHTIQGDIVVNGVVASTYTSVQLSTLTHMLLSVERAAFRLGFSVLGNMLEVQRPAVLSWYMRTFGSA